MAKMSFPAAFLWGVATSAQQIEGGRREGGRLDSIWDRFADVPGHVADGSSPEIACDHYHRWREDVGLLRDLGVGAYRFSIAWPRIVPTGRGQVNSAGLDFYDGLVDALLADGIEPFPTLYHWDLPQRLQDEGGWANRDTVAAFVDYARHVVNRLGDRVKFWTTHNEPWCIATLGHEEGHHAPGHRDPAEALAVAHHVLLSHGEATRAIREAAPQAKAGIVMMHVPVQAASDRPEDHDAARWMDGFFNRWYLDPLFLGRYPEDALADRRRLGHIEGDRVPAVRDGDLKIIATPTDFLGVNYYSRLVVRAGSDGRPQAVPQRPAEDLTEMGWEVYPEGLESSLVRLHQEYSPARIFVTENGAAYDDAADPEGRIRDTRRIDFLRDHVRAAHRAHSRGVPLGGYFVWSLMDNFEWGHGLSKHFGLYAVNPETLERTPRDSVAWYRELVSSNEVVNEVTT
jgi:beta-glucosidase